MSIVNFNSTTPAAPGGYSNVTFQQSGDNVSAYYTAGSGGVFPFTIFQEGGGDSGASSVSSYTFTFPQALQSGGATAFILVGTDGSASVTPPAGWTVDINQTASTYARFMLLHKTSASETTAVFGISTTSIAVYFFEISGSHALDQSSTGASANAGLIALPAITPTVNALVFGAVATVLGGTSPLSYSASITPALNPGYKTISVCSQVPGSGRGLGFHVGTVGAGAVLTTPPAATIATQLYSGGGIAYATFSIL